MKKRLLSVALVICMIVSFTACGGKKAQINDYDYDLSEYIKIGQYEGIEYTLEPFTVQNGDVASIDYVGTIDGEEFEGGSGSYNLTIGSAAFIPGFEDGLIGYTVGDKVTLELAFPDDYKNNPDLAGKPVTFDVTVNAINGYTSSDDRIQEIVWNKYYEGCEILGYPEKELNATKEQQYDYYKSYATAYGMLFKDFLETMGTNEEEFEADVTAYAESMVAQDMALYALVREAGLTADDEMKEKAKADMLAAYGVEDEKEFEKQYNVKMKDPTVQNSIEMSALLYTALDYLADNAVEVEL